MPDTPSPVFQWPDLSRTLSKSHARLEWDGHRAWVTDLRLHQRHRPAHGRRRPAAHRAPAHALPPTAVLALGDRVLTVAVPA